MLAFRANSGTVKKHIRSDCLSRIDREAARYDSLIVSRLQCRGAGLACRIIKTVARLVDWNLQVFAILRVCRDGHRSGCI